MKIVCLIKQVPRADSIEFDQETKQLKREGVPLEQFTLDDLEWVAELLGVEYNLV